METTPKTKMSIEFRVANIWANEIDVATRIANIVVGITFEDVPYEKDNGIWVLDVGNNLFLHLKTLAVKYSIYELTYRYSKPAKFMNALKIVIEEIMYK